MSSVQNAQMYPVYLYAKCDIDVYTVPSVSYSHRQDSHTGHSKADGSRRRLKTRTPIRVGTDKGD